MRAAIGVTVIAAVAGQDVFLAKTNTTEDELSATTRRRRRRSTGTCAGGDLSQCVDYCLTNDHDKNFVDCNHDGSSSCADSRCCEREGYTCFVKNAYWSSCAPQCKTGVPDSRGEMWDCTATSPSNCGVLKSCVGDCRNNCKSADLALEEEEEEAGPRPTRGPNPPGRKGGACRGGSKSACKKVCHYPSAALTQLCLDECDKNCPDEPEKQCPKADLSTCVKECSGESNAPEHGDKCEHDGATSCLNSKCCQNPSDTCFTKNPYWAACTGECKPGKKNPSDGQIWDCKEIKPNVVCDPYLYRACVSNCHDQC